MSRELDREVAEIVFGQGGIVQIRKISGKGVTPDIGTTRPYETADGRKLVAAKAIPNYSTSMEAAMLIVESMKNRPHYVGFEFSDRQTENLSPTETGKWYAGFCVGTGSYNPVAAETLPEAICRAALAAVRSSA